MEAYSTKFHKSEVYDKLDVQVLEVNNKTTCLELVVKDSKTNEIETLRYNNHWLRFNDRSSDSKYSSTEQKKIVTFDIPLELELDSVTRDDEFLIIKWKQADLQQAAFPIRWLLDNYPLKPTLKSFAAQGVFEKNSKSVPVVDYNGFFTESPEQNDKNILEWLKHVEIYGLCIVKNLPCEPKQVRKLAELVCPIEFTMYGDVWDVKIEADPFALPDTNNALEFHQDLVYFDSKPGLQFLHCIKNDVVTQGGQSVFLDAHRAAEEFREQHPDLFAILAKVPATFQMVNYKHARPVHIIKRRPHIVVDYLGKVVEVNWQPNVEGILTDLTSQADIDLYYKAYMTFSRFINHHPNVMEFTLTPGDVVCFNNRLMVHGRRAFKQNSARHLQGVYVNNDNFKSAILYREFQQLQKAKN